MANILQNKYSKIK